jgi:hypothetical protein
MATPPRPSLHVRPGTAKHRDRLNGPLQQAKLSAATCPLSLVLSLAPPPAQRWPPRRAAGRLESMCNDGQDPCGFVGAHDGVIAVSAPWCAAESLALRPRGSVGRVRRRAASVCESRRRARESVSPATNAMPMASTGRRHGSPSRLPPCPYVPPMATNCTWRAGDLRSRRRGGGSIGSRAWALWPASTAIPVIVTDVRAVMLDVAVHPRRAVLIPST